MNNYFADEKYCNDWILTKDKNPPRGCWVLATRKNWQKPLEIMCYQGIRVGEKWSKDTNWEHVEYEYPSWTSGYGDICEPPIAWQFLPVPYDWEDIVERNDNTDKIEELYRGN